jgi:hypothetical protein
MDYAMMATSTVMSRRSALETRFIG